MDPITQDTFKDNRHIHLYYMHEHDIHNLTQSVPRRQINVISNLINQLYVTQFPTNVSFWSNFEPVQLRYLKNSTSGQQIMTTGSF